MVNEDMMERIETIVAYLERIESDMIDTSVEAENPNRYNIELAIRNLLQVTQD